MKMYVHTYLIIDCKTMYVAHSMSSKHTQHCHTFSLMPRKYVHD